MMTGKEERLLKEAMGLPAEARAAIAGYLIQSLDSTHDDGVEAAWSEEIRRRLEQVSSGEVAAVPWEEARHGIRS
jgi:putative addiction module component (TIGR02574 family)